LVYRQSKASGSVWLERSPRSR